METAITVEHLSKRFGEMVVYDDFSTSFAAGKITVLFGPNGSGKTTLLNILAGVEKANNGSIDLRQPSSEPTPAEDGRLTADGPLLTSYIFQNYRDSLLPWKTAYDNLVFPLVLRKKKRDEIAKLVQNLACEFAIDFDLERYPYELSGGQQQLLAFLRAIVTKPQLLLVDEPFSALDYENNLKLRGALLRYYDIHQPTIILITHDIEEAVHLGHEIVVLSRKPTRIIERIKNPLPFPRTIATLQSEMFHQTKNKVLAAFEKACIPLLLSPSENSRERLGFCMGTTVRLAREAFPTSSETKSLVVGRAEPLR